MESVEVTAGALAVSGLPQDIPSFQKNSNVITRAWYEKLPLQNLLRYLFQFLGKIFPWASPPRPVETHGSGEHPALPSDRPVHHAKKHLGVLVRYFLAFIPSRITRLLGFLPMDNLGDNSTPQETLETPVNPLRKGSKRKQEDLVNPSDKGSKRKQEDLLLEEHQCWAETLQQELSEEDDPADPSYEPPKSLDSDSEEYKSQNDTETDLEFEEEDGVVMLKENPNQGEAPNGDDKLGESKAGANEEQALTSQTSAESDHPINLSLKSNSGKSVTLEDRVEKSEKDAQVQEILVGSVPGAADMTTSTDSQEQWVEVSGE